MVSITVHSHNIVILCMFVCRCKDVNYGENELDISVITVVQYSDSVSVILRMLVSLLQRTPQQVLKEIILMNDAAVWDKG